MYKLSMFQKFDFASWQKDKSFMIQGVKYNAKRKCVCLDIVIYEDFTDYKDPSVSNLFEKFRTYLVKDIDEDDVEKYHVQDKIAFVSVGKCSVWGDYQNQLSVEAEVEVLE
ncbi:MAG: hypothetical protein PUE12_16635 [Oscillospiraceae bacterium]|nr:hypothetical protein [Oscillospiraceae bacterium]